MGFPTATRSDTSSADERFDPWFRVHPAVALAVAVGMFVAVTAVRLAVAGKEDPISELYSLPIALLAFAFGARAGVAAGASAVVLIASWVLIADVEMTPLGWATRVIPLLLLGSLVGVAADRIRTAQERERRLAAISALQREAAEVNDSIVQGLAVSKWLLESDEPARALVAVTETMMTAQALVSQMLGPNSPLPGDLRRSRPVPRS